MLQPLHPYGAVLNLDVIDFRNIEKLIDEWVAAIKIAATTLKLDKENFIKLVELSLEGSMKIRIIPQLILKPATLDRVLSLESQRAKGFGSNRAHRHPYSQMAAVRRPSLSRSGSGDDGILSRISDYAIVRKGKGAACDAAYVAKRLLKSTGKAAWIAATTFIVLGIPLIIEMDREAQLNEAELQQASLLGGAAPGQPAFMAPPK
ncbi:UNVERIFIED_CONTAM: Mitochondrial import receptor subunit TOM9-2 [Sesamum calycinum]|uniref:Mitochondrial import receptor subunit TOM9-2 n=1 Tax=Sesamum calycinum TaxID=2727403 RepID=A0AAW2QL48_9LAMI